MAALAGLLAVLPVWSVIVAALLAVLFALRASPVTGVLATDSESGVWRLQQNGSRSDLQLVHSWHGPGWTTLKFVSLSRRKPLHLTVWRSNVSSAEWRLLRQLTLRRNMQIRPSLEGQ